MCHFGNFWLGAFATPQQSAFDVLSYSQESLILPVASSAQNAANTACLVPSLSHPPRSLGSSPTALAAQTSSCMALPQVVWPNELNLGVD